MLHTAPTLVERQADLDRLCGGWRGAAVLALDTEFERSRTFYAQPALVQISDGTGNYLIDPIRIADPAPLAALLSDPATTIVLHAGSEDLEVIERLGGRGLGTIFDTQIACALLGYGYALGYRHLVARLFGVELPKSETRSDWLQRPLSPRQREYAALDVAYLLPAYERLREELLARRRHEWLEEECARSLARGRYNGDEAGEAYLKVGAAWRLGRRELGVLRALCAWREHEARRRDIPRGHVLQDPALRALAKALPADRDALAGLEALPGREVRRSAEVWFDIVRTVMALPEEKLPPPLSQPMDLRPHRHVVKRLKAVVRERAAALEVCAEILAGSRALEALLRHALGAERIELTPHFEGWREAVIGPPLLDVLRRALTSC